MHVSMRIPAKRELGKAAIALFGVTVTQDAAWASSELTAASQACSERMAELTTSADFWRWVHIASAAVGGTVASVSGMKAGLSTSSASRRWGFMALLSGGLAAASPLFPKPEEFAVLSAAADRHYIVGLKVQRQIGFLPIDSTSQVSTEKYAIARFTDCLAKQPPADIPDLPPTLVVDSDILGTIKGPNIQSPEIYFSVDKDRG